MKVGGQNEAREHTNVLTEGKTVPSTQSLQSIKYLKPEVEEKPPWSSQALRSLTMSFNAMKPSRFCHPGMVYLALIRLDLEIINALFHLLQTC